MSSLSAYLCLFSLFKDEFQDQATALNKNLSTVAIVAASDDVPLDAFTCELVHSLLAIGKEYFFLDLLLSILNRS